MQFELRAGSEHFTTSVYVFPGDEQVDLEQYQRCITNGYVSSVCTIMGAAESFGLNIDAETFERWKRVGTAAGLLDDFLDESPDFEMSYTLYQSGLASISKDSDTQITSDEVPEWADERLLPTVILLRNSIKHLPARQVETLVESAMNIGDAQRAKALCSDMREYIELLKQEAYHTSILIYESMSPGVQMQPGFDDFSKWCRNAIELGTLADSSRDLWSDRRTGRTKVGASVINSARIAFQMRRPIYNLIRPKTNRLATDASLLTRRKFYK